MYGLIFIPAYTVSSSGKFISITTSVSYFSISSTQWSKVSSMSKMRSFGFSDFGKITSGT